MFVKKSLISGVMACAVLLGVGSSLHPVGAVNQQPDTGKKGSESGKVVDVYLHGVLGTSSSLSTMIRNTTGAKKSGESVRFGLKYSGQKATYVCVDNTIYIDTYKVSSSESVKRKAYDVVFSDNTGTIDKQVKYIKTIVDNLSSKGARVNLIGHSMGGLSATSYATKYDSKLTTPKVNKLITIGSPLLGSSKADVAEFFAATQGVSIINLNPFSLIYNVSTTFGIRPKFALDDLKYNSDAVKSVFSNGKTVSSKTKVYSVYGGTYSKVSKKYSDASDKVVSKDSALYLKKKVKASNFSSYYAKGVSHTSLMNDKAVASKVSSWIK